LKTKIYFARLLELKNRKAEMRKCGRFSAAGRRILNISDNKRQADFSFDLSGLFARAAGFGSSGLESSNRSVRKSIGR